MGNLKHEMRQLFEERYSKGLNEKNTRFEEGLLEKIINVTFRNLYSFNPYPWKIIAIKSVMHLQRLFRIVDDRRITESGVALLVMDASPNNGMADVNDCRGRSGGNSELELLSMSLMYAAKYYYIDSFIIKDFNRDQVIREFAFDTKRPLAAIIGLGSFGGTVTPTTGWSFSDIVSVIK